MSIQKPPLRVEYALIGLLLRQPMHAYDVYQQLARPTGLGSIWRVKQSHLYALLDRLLADGLLEGTLTAQAARPPRRMLTVTPAGREAFFAWVQAPVTHGRDFRLEFLAKLYCSHAHGDAQALLTCQKAACDEWLRALDQRIAGESDTFDQAVLTFRRGQIAAIIHWLAEQAVIYADLRAAQ